MARKRKKPPLNKREIIEKFSMIRNLKSIQERFIIYFHIVVD